MGLFDLTGNAKSLTAAFRNNVEYVREGHNLTIQCKRGFWSVSGTESAQVENEAWMYFRQYYGDGEYNDDR